jgi:tetratricopeptide (TPR) repeat protein
MRENGKAIADCNKAMELEPKYNMHGVRAAAYANLGQYDEAIADYDEAIHLTPNAAPLYVYRGMVFASKGDFASALADANAAITLDPKNEEVRRRRDWIKQRASEKAEGLRAVPRTQRPKNDIEFGNLGDVLK